MLAKLFLSFSLIVSVAGFSESSNHQLTQDLQKAADEAAKKTPENKRAIMQKGIEELKASGAVEKAKKVGDTAPAFELLDVKVGKVSSAKLLKEGPLVVTFYRGGWCPYCNLQLHALEKALPLFKAKNANLVAISPQTPDNSLSTAQKANLTYYVLSDKGGKVARKYGLLFKLSPELKQLYQEFGLDLTKTNGTKEWELPMAATYVIAPNGKIIYSVIDADYTKRADPDDVLAALETKS